MPNFPKSVTYFTFLILPLARNTETGRSLKNINWKEIQGNYLVESCGGKLFRQIYLWNDRLVPNNQARSAQQWDKNHYSEMSQAELARESRGYTLPTQTFCTEKQILSSLPQSSWLKNYQQHSIQGILIQHKSPENFLEVPSRTS